jgi:hypothetical protein
MVFVGLIRQWREWLWQSCLPSTGRTIKMHFLFGLAISLEEVVRPDGVPSASTQPTNTLDIPI